MRGISWSRGTLLALIDAIIGLARAFLFIAVLEYYHAHDPVADLHPAGHVLASVLGLAEPERAQLAALLLRLLLVGHHAVSSGQVTGASLPQSSPAALE